MSLSQLESELREILSRDHILRSDIVKVAARWMMHSGTTIPQSFDIWNKTMSSLVKELIITPDDIKE